MNAHLVASSHVEAEVTNACGIVHPWGKLTAAYFYPQMHLGTKRSCTTNLKFRFGNEH